MITSPAQMIADTFVSLYHPLYALSELPSGRTDYEYDGFSTYLEYFEETLDRILSRFHEDVLQSKLSSPSDSFTEMRAVVEKRIERLFQMAFPDFDGSVVTKHAQLFTSSVFELLDESTPIAQIAELLNIDSISTTTRELFSSFDYRPQSHFQLVPQLVNTDRAGTIEINTAGSTDNRAMLTLGIAEVPHLAYYLYHGLSGALLHELLCHRSVDHLLPKHPGIAHLERSNYFAHGWLRAFPLMHGELSRLNSTRVHWRFHDQCLQKVKRHTRETLGNNSAAKAGFDDALVIYDAFSDPLLCRSTVHRQALNPPRVEDRLRTLQFADKMFQRLLGDVLKSIADGVLPADLEGAMRHFAQWIHYVPGRLPETLSRVLTEYFEEKVRFADFTSAILGTAE